MSSAVTSPVIGSDDDGGASPPLEGAEGSDGAGSVPYVSLTSRFECISCYTLWLRLVMSFL